MDKELFLQAMTKTHKLTSVAPTSYNEAVGKLLDELDVDAPPMRVPVKYEPYSNPASCYYNVAEKVRRNGGGIVYGWAIWQSDYLCEAEHHAVWHDENGILLDITPREPHFDTITFVQDADRPFKGISIPSVRVNPTTNAVVDDFILAVDILDWTRRYEKRTDILHFTRPPLVSEYVGDDDKPGPLKKIAHNLELFILMGNTEDSICFCPSKELYKNCCGKTNESNLSIYVNNIIATCGEAPE